MDGSPSASEAHAVTDGMAWLLSEFHPSMPVQSDESDGTGGALEPAYVKAESPAHGFGSDISDSNDEEDVKRRRGVSIDTRIGAVPMIQLCPSSEGVPAPPPPPPPPHEKEDAGEEGTTAEEPPRSPPQQHVMSDGEEKLS